MRRNIRQDSSEAAATEVEEGSGEDSAAVAGLEVEEVVVLAEAEEQEGAAAKDDQ